MQRNKVSQTSVFPYISSILLTTSLRSPINVCFRETYHTMWYVPRIKSIISLQESITDNYTEKNVRNFSRFLTLSLTVSFTPTCAFINLKFFVSPFIYLDPSQFHPSWILTYLCLYRLKYMSINIKRSKTLSLIHI